MPQSKNYNEVHIPAQNVCHNILNLFHLFLMFCLCKRGMASHPIWLRLDFLYYVRYWYMLTRAEQILSD